MTWYGTVWWSIIVTGSAMGKDEHSHMAGERTWNDSTNVDKTMKSCAFIASGSPGHLVSWSPKSYLLLLTVLNRERSAQLHPVREAQSALGAASLVTSWEGGSGRQVQHFHHSSSQVQQKITRKHCPLSLLTYSSWNASGKHWVFANLYHNTVFGCLESKHD